MPKPDPQFYKDGLSFECTACGKCCENHGEYTAVYLTKQDQAEMAKALSVSQQDFLKTYCEKEDEDYTLKDVGDRCIFLDTRGQCKVYTARPLQCRTFPFWPETLNAQTWKTEIQKDCPGTNTEKRVPKEKIETFLQWEEQEKYVNNSL